MEVKESIEDFEGEVAEIKEGSHGGIGSELKFDTEDELENEEVRETKLMRDPGAPTRQEVELHNATHMPFRAWCPACVSGKARDRHHRIQSEQEKGVVELVFDYGLLGGREGE